MAERNRRAADVQNLQDENIRLERDLFESQLKILRFEKSELEKQLDASNAAFEELQTKYNRLSDSYRSTTVKLERMTSDHEAVLTSISWKLMSPMRKLGIALKKYRLIARIMKGLKILLLQGPAPIVARFRHVNRYSKLSGYYKISSKRRAEEEQTTFEKEMTFSVLVPLYNTPIKYLKEMIESVQKQTYRNWELCLADGSDHDHSNVETFVKQLAQADPRIRYVKLDENRGIAANTNACIDISTGNYIALFDHDDLLHPSALFRIAQTIEQTGADFVYTDEATFIKDNPKNVITAHFKPDFSADTLRSYNYICHLSVFSRELMNQVGVFRPECDGSQDYDLILRLTEKAQHIVHIPELLYYWRSHQNSTAQDIKSKPYIVKAAHKALGDHLNRIGLEGEVDNSDIPSTYRIRYSIKEKPLVSIIIANKDQVDTLDTCIRSIFKKTTYPNFEIIIVENNSTSQLTFAYYKQLQDEYANVRVITWPDGFNYSAINNFGFAEAKGEHVILLNNDVEIITPSWIEEMLMFSQRDDVGAVGAMLYYPDDTIQHAGVILGIGGVAGHSHKYFARGDGGYMSRASIAQNLSAVTFACVMMPSKVFREVNGLDEAFQVAFNDVDMCMRIRKAGYHIVFTPYCELYHYESKSRGQEDTPAKVKRFNSEIARFQTRWGKELEAGDPYYNKNLTLVHEDFSLNSSI